MRARISGASAKTGQCCAVALTRGISVCAVSKKVLARKPFSEARYERHAYVGVMHTGARGSALQSAE